MIFRELDTVVLERDVPERGLRKGDIGAVVHVHGDSALEVEFVRASGRTQAVVQLTLPMCGLSRMKTFQQCAPTRLRGGAPHNPISSIKRAASAPVFAGSDRNPTNLLF